MRRTKRTINNASQNHNAPFPGQRGGGSTLTRRNVRRLERKPTKRKKKKNNNTHPPVRQALASETNGFALRIALLLRLLRLLVRLVVIVVMMGSVVLREAGLEGGDLLLQSD